MIRKEVYTQILQLASEVDLVQDKDTLKDVRSYIITAINHIKVRKDVKKPLSVVINAPANKGLQSQSPFYSTRKRRKKSTVRIAKPTTQQKADICSALLEKSAPLYSSCTTTKTVSRNTSSKCALILCM